MTKIRSKYRDKYLDFSEYFKKKYAQILNTDYNPAYHDTYDPLIITNAILHS